jgi:hypothetical protein
MGNKWYCSSHISGVERDSAIMKLIYRNVSAFIGWNKGNPFLLSGTIKKNKTVMKTINKRLRINLPGKSEGA